MSAASAAARPDNGRRKPVLELASLERDCMRTLWPLGEASVRQIRDELGARRPRAYTTILTIMDRLAQKGIVTRRKVARAYLYRPNVSAEQARAYALGQLVENFFAGSEESLQAFLAGERAPVEVPMPAAESPAPARRVGQDNEPARAGRTPVQTGRMDDTLL